MERRYTKQDLVDFINFVSSNATKTMLNRYSVDELENFMTNHGLWDKFDKVIGFLRTDRKVMQALNKVGKAKK